MMWLIFIFLAVLSPQELQSLAEAIKKGDATAFKSFFDATQEDILRFLVSRGLSLEDAEDIVQQAFVTIWEQRATIDAQKSLKAYLFRIGYTRMLNHYRDRAKFSDSMPEQMHAEEQRTDGSLLEHEVQQRVKEAIKNLPEKRQMVFQLCFMQEFSYNEAAETLGVSVKTIENHMTLAFKNVREALSDLRESEQ